MIVEGQVQGGIAQGAGQALMEQAMYDPESGQLITGSLMDYAMPRADDFPPSMTNDFDRGRALQDQPARRRRACGELGTIGAPMAIVHAVLDALARPRREAPRDAATSEKVWRALNGAA